MPAATSRTTASRSQLKRSTVALAFKVELFNLSTPPLTLTSSYFHFFSFL
jgi:hypothetical protein